MERGNTPPDTTNREAVEALTRHKNTKSTDANASQLNLIRGKESARNGAEAGSSEHVDFDRVRDRISSTFPIKTKDQPSNQNPFEAAQDDPDMPDPADVSPVSVIQAKNLHLTEESFQGSARESIGTVTPPP